MSHPLLGAGALALGVALFGAAPAAAQARDSVAAPHVMATVVVNGSNAQQRRPSPGENTRLRRELARYDARLVGLQLQLDSLKTYADSLDRDRVHFEAAAAQARARRAQIEQRLRDLEARSAPVADSTLATP
jgi:septal ring factor EnvC (AmiA/AmiB activator)